MCVVLQIFQFGTLEKDFYIILLSFSQYFPVFSNFVFPVFDKYLL